MEQVIAQSGNFLSDQWRSLWMFFDIVLYKFLSFLQKLFVFVAEVDVLDIGKVNEIYRRIWLILGLFMLFILAFSLIRMLVDPDKMTDKSKGISKLIFRVLVSVVLLVTIGTIFSEAKNIQKMLLSFDSNTNVIGKLLDMDYGAQIVGDDNVANIGVNFSKEVFFTFFKESDAFPRRPEDNTSTENTVEEIKSEIDSGDKFDVLSNYVNLKDNEEKVYYYNYTWLLSTLTGGFLCWIFINYCIAVGVRVFQLAYLQLIAPIPIFSYISESGQQTFKKWVSQCVTTYLDIFLRVFIIYLSIYLVGLVQSGIENGFNIGILSGDSSMIGWVKIVLIIAVLMFAKKAPELIKELFPSTSKAAGDLGLNLRKNLKGMLGAGVVGGLVSRGATLGKKTVAGFDALAHGEKFGTGWSKIQGKGPLNKIKTGLNSMMPFSTEARNNRAQAQAEFNKKQNLINKGKKFATADGKLNEKSFKSEDYLKSYQAVGAAKERVKNANHNLEMARANLQAAYNNGGDVKNAQKVYQVAANGVAAAQGALEKSKAHHETMKKIHVNDAQIEAAYNAYSDSLKDNSSMSNRGVSSYQQQTGNVAGPRPIDISSQTSASAQQTGNVGGPPPIDITGGSLNNGSTSSGTSSSSSSGPKWKLTSKN